MSYERKISIPKQLRLAESVYSLKLDQLDLTHADGCTFDFSLFEFGEPFPILLLAEKIKSLVKRSPERKFRLIPGRGAGRTYLEHIGFFQYVGWKTGRLPGEAWGSRGYIPIETFNLKIYRSAAGKGPVGKLINREASRLAEVLSQASQGALFDILQYSIREMMRNAAEHSLGERVTVFGQYWPTKGEGEIAIADNGVGIPSTLYDNEYIECNTAREALKFALLPGVTGVALDDRIGQDDHWGNSGFGLYVTSRICSQNGTFRVASDEAGLTLARGKQTEHSWRFAGTCIQLRLKLSDPEGTQKAIKPLIEDAEEQHRKIIAHYPIKASAASKMLESEFRKMKSHGQ